MRFNDSVFGVILIVFAIAEISYTRTFPRLHGQDYGPDLFPIIIGAGLMLFGGILIARGWAQRATQPLVVVGDWAHDRGNVVNVFILVGSVVFYILFSTWLGFIPTALLIQTVLLVTAWFQSGRQCHHCRNLHHGDPFTVCKTAAGAPALGPAVTGCVVTWKQSSKPLPL